MNNALETLPIADAPVMDLAARRTALEGRVGTLRSDAATAILDGASPDLSALSAAEAELEAIGLAEGEARRRERADADRSERQRLAGLRKTVTRLLADHRMAVAEAEVSARMVADALVRAEGARTTLIAALKGLGVRQPIGLTRNVHDGGVSHRLGAVLSKVTDGHWKLGDFRLPVGRADAGAAWTEISDKIAAEIEATMKGNKE